MNESPLPGDLISDVRQIWDAKAPYWDERMGDGNLFQNELIGPAVDRLLDIQPDQLVLDVGCGNGVASRRLARLGARVIAVDTSVEFLELARKRAPELADRIDYRFIDGTDEPGLLALGEGKFNAILANMVLMDMPVIEPLLRASAKLLSPAGRFVFSIQHPAFNSNAVGLRAETQTQADGREIPIHSLRIDDYLYVPAGKGTGMPGESVAHWYFHRPLHQLFAAFFAAGFVLDGLEEPGFTSKSTDDWRISWLNMPGIPPVLVARFFLRP
jgi:SAM-dependent methyltransferase